MPTASAAPAASSASASAGSWMREVAISGTESCARRMLAGSRIASRATGGGGTIQAEPA